MSSLVFGCPNCQQPFQVAASQAGQVVQCPSCAQAVEISADAFAAPPAPPAPVAQEPQAFGCPSCGGQFGVTQEMNGQQVACPHCQAPTMIQLNGPAQPASAEPTIAPVDPEPEDEGPLIKTHLPVSRKKKKKLRRIAKSRGPTRIDQDLFAPNHDPGETAPPAAPPASAPSPPVAKPATPAPAPPASQNTPIAAEPSTPPAAPSPAAPSPPAQAEAKPTPPKPASAKPTPPKTAPAKTAPAKKGPATSGKTNQEPKPQPASLPPLVPQLRSVDPATKSKLETESTTTQSAQQEPQTSATESSIASGIRQADTEQKKGIGAPEQNSASSIAHLLPPKFDVLDPARMGSEKFKVVLPDGQGGVAQMDNRVLRVKHEGKQVSLVSMTPEQQARQRLIQNIVAILIGIVIMAIAFTILM